MADQVTRYNIFIASPSGLSPERQAFRDSIREYNETEALDRGVLYVPLGWEMTLGGVGRPQALINDDVRRCDYMVLVLWDRWGSSPDNESGKHSSGTEEEYHVALECLNDPAKPMKDVVVFFKTVDPRQLSDPGQQLQKVLDFKRQLELRKTLLYQSFDDVTGFETVLRRHLAKWVRDHESSVHPEAKATADNGNVGSDSIAQVLMTIGPRALAPEHGDLVFSDSDQPDETNLTRYAQDLENKGQLIEAEVALASAAVREDDLHAMNAYARLLGDSGRFSQAEKVYRRIIELAAEEQDYDWLATGCNNLALGYRQKGDLAQALSLFLKAQEYLELGELSESREAAPIYANLGFVNRLLAKYDQAEELFTRSLDIRKKWYGEQSLAVAFSLGFLGNLHLCQGRYEEAESTLQLALDLYDTYPPDINKAAALTNLGRLYGIRGELDEADGCFIDALETLVASGGQERIEMMYVLENSAIHVLTPKGELTTAARRLQDVVAVKEAALGPEHYSLAESLNNLAGVMVKMAKFDEAETACRRALKINRKVFGLEHPSIADCLETLAFLYGKQGGTDEAEALLRQAIVMREKTLGPSHPSVATALVSLADTLNATGLERSRLLSKACSILEEHLGAENPQTQAVLAALDRLTQE